MEKYEIISNLISVESEFKKELEKWLRSFSNDRLIEEAEVLERLIDNDDFANSLLWDTGWYMLQVVYEECVQRLKQSCTHTTE
ncbi:MAG: hypothetical protein IJX66_07100 [Lachnospiraceae bacterium]|nr:hypothetical protein [Lachnospiraceae bacterium]